MADMDGGMDGDWEGDARRAGEAVEAFLRERSEREPPEFTALLELRLAIARVSEAEIVRRDAEANAILRDMAVAEDMERLHVEIDRLAARVAVLTGIPVRQAPPEGASPPVEPPQPARPVRRMMRI